MTVELKEIKEIRRKLGLTQSQLARCANVSQSLIAKIESGRLDPTYSNAMKIFSAVDTLERKKEAKAEEIMSEKIISVTPDTSLRETISKMKKHGISQLPVIVEHKAVGIITESDILEALLNKKGNTVEDVMESPPPVVSTESSLSVVSHLLKYVQMVLVSKRGSLTGVITKSDLLAKAYR